MLIICLVTGVAVLMYWDLARRLLLLQYHVYKRPPIADVHSTRLPTHSVGSASRLE